MSIALPQSNKWIPADLPSGKHEDLYFRRADYLVPPSRVNFFDGANINSWIIPEDNSTAISIPQIEAVSSLTTSCGLRILMAEDSKEQQVFVRFLLKNTSYTVDFADNGLEAVDRFQEGHYDLVFMDMRMPKMDGLEATRKIREWESEHTELRVPIVALTGLSGKSEIQKCREAGCTDHLAKPFSQKDFFKKLE